MVGRNKITCEQTDDYVKLNYVEIIFGKTLEPIRRRLIPQAILVAIENNICRTYQSLFWQVLGPKILLVMLHDNPSMQNEGLLQGSPICLGTIHSIRPKKSLPPLLQCNPSAQHPD